MIVYGTRATLTKSELTADTCPHCGTHGSVQMNVFQRYAHVFWIPFFPIGKTGVSQCQHCKQILKLKEMPTSLRLSYDNLKAHSKIPIWQFSGVFVLIAITIAVTINEKHRSQKVAQMIAEPKVSDVLQIRTKDEQYTLIKITQVAGDTVYFCYNKYQTNQLSGLADLAKKDYETELREISKSELIEMNNKDEIIDIDR